MPYEVIREFEDRAVQWLLRSPARVAELIAIALPEVAGALEPASLRSRSARLVSARLRRLEEDVHWEGRLRSGARFRLLVGHQSRPDRLIALRFHLAAAHVDEDVHRELERGGVHRRRRRWPVVVPVLVSTAPRAWSPPGLTALQDADPALAPFARDLTVGVLDLADASEALLVERGGVLGALLALLAAQYAPGPAFLLALERALTRLRILLPAEERFLEMASFCWQLVWNRRREEERAMLKRVFDRHVEPKEVEVMGRTMAEAERERGRAEGRVEARQEDLLSLLAIRFPPSVPTELADAVRAVRDPRRLEQLFASAARAASLEELARALSGERSDEAG